MKKNYLSIRSGEQIGSGIKLHDAAADTRQQGKRYGVRLSLLERNRAILKDYYALTGKTSKPQMYSVLTKEYGLSRYRIWEILKKMRGM
jgi:hypothetical protein